MRQQLAGLRDVRVGPFLTTRAVFGVADFHDGETLRFRFRPMGKRPERCDLSTIPHAIAVTSTAKEREVADAARAWLAEHDRAMENGGDAWALLRAVLPYAESRAEDMQASAAAQGVGFDQARKATEAVDAARAALDGKPSPVATPRIDGDTLVISDNGAKWTHTLEKFLRINADGIDQLEAATIATTLARGETYHGGGAAAAWSVRLAGPGEKPGAELDDSALVTLNTDNTGEEFLTWGEFKAANADLKPTEIVDIAGDLMAGQTHHGGDAHDGGTFTLCLTADPA